MSEEIEREWTAIEIRETDPGWLAQRLNRPGRHVMEWLARWHMIWDGASDEVVP
jgi:hypothetical protein